MLLARAPARVGASQDWKTGEVAEWLKVPAWKAGVGKPTGGSNPPLSASFRFEDVRDRRSLNYANRYTLA